MSQLSVIAGRYQLLEEIGQGGMGTVYRACDQITQEIVAVKALKPEIVKLDPSLVERFDREGEALRRLNHPNIVKVLATVQENNNHYIVMEYVGGGTLADLLAKYEHLPIDRFLEIALDLADALTRAHRLKILHRDIKPANILLADDGTPRLTDFGVARIGDRTRVTEAGTIVGSYGYLSPEAVQGTDVDERSDIWSFGVVLYEMLAGRRPFEETQVGAMIGAILTKPVPELSAFRADVPPVLTSLIHRMLEKDQTQRINSVRLVGAELEAIIQGADTLNVAIDSSLRQQVIEVPRFDTPTPEFQFPPPTPGTTHIHPQVVTDPNTGEEYLLVPKRSKLFLKITTPIVLVLAVIGAIFLLTRPPHVLSELRDGPPVLEGEYLVLVAQLENLGGETREAARFITDNLDQTFDAVPFSRIRVEQSDETVVSEEQARELAQDSEATVIIWGNYDAAGVTLNIQVGDPKAFELLEMAPQVIEHTADVRVTLTNEREQSVAPQVLALLGVLQAADGDGYEFMRTIAILDTINVNAAAISGSGVATAVHRYFTLYLQDTDAALAAMDKALQLDASNPILYGLYGVALQRQQRFDEASRAAETAKRLGPTNWTLPLYLEANGQHTDVASVVAVLSQIVEARPDDWFPLSFRGSMYYEAGDYEKARADLERSIELQPTTNYPYVFATLIAIREARISDARELVAQILKDYSDPTLTERIMAATFGYSADENYLGVMLSAFGNLVMGQYDRALAAVDSAGDMASYIPDMAFMRGVAQCELGNYEGAAKSFEATLALDPTLGFAYMLQASALQKLGQTEAANELFATAEPQAADNPELQTMIEEFRSGAQGCDTIF